MHISIIYMGVSNHRCVKLLPLFHSIYEAECEVIDPDTNTVKCVRKNQEGVVEVCLPPVFCSLAADKSIFMSSSWFYALRSRSRTCA